MTVYETPDLLTMYDLLKYINTVTNDLFGIILLFVIQIILIIILYRKGQAFLSSIATSSVVTLLLCSMLVAGDIVNPYWLPLFFAGSVLVFLLNWIKSENIKSKYGG